MTAVWYDPTDRERKDVKPKEATAGEQQAPGRRRRRRRRASPGDTKRGAGADELGLCWEDVNEDPGADGADVSLGGGGSRAREEAVEEAEGAAKREDPREAVEEMEGVGGAGEMPGTDQLECGAGWSGWCAEADRLRLEKRLEEMALTAAESRNKVPMKGGERE